MQIRPYTPADQEEVVSIWERCGLTRPWNDPRKDIARKLLVQPELFLVGVSEGRIVATAMAGYDGHRGWLSYLAVDPSLQGTGLGRALLERVEDLLLARGCPKLNVQIRTDNQRVAELYRHLGYRDDAALSLGKRLIED